MTFILYYIKIFQFIALKVCQEIEQVGAKLARGISTPCEITKPAALCQHPSAAPSAEYRGILIHIYIFKFKCAE